MRMSEEQVIYCREHYKANDAEFGLNALAKKFGVNVDTMRNIVHGLTRKEVGGPIHPARERATLPPVLDEIKEAIIIAHDEDHLTLKELMERFSLSKEQVKAVLSEAGIKLRKRQTFDEETKQRVIGEYLAGKSLRRLAEETGINRATITVWVKDFMPEKSGNPAKAPFELDDYTREQIYRFYSRGHGVVSIGKALGVPQSIVRKVIDGLL